MKVPILWQYFDGNVIGAQLGVRFMFLHYHNLCVASVFGSITELNRLDVGEMETEA